MSKINTYDLEFKQSSVKLAVDSGQTMVQTAKDLGVNVNTLHGWVAKYCKKANASHQQEAEPNQAEKIKQLKKQVARLKQERDILKKAAAYFASEAL
ncbi:MAG: transposase [Gammaproteobacteria bacterium]|nr:transposase [Gammaproteobacteria bacterium]